MTETQTDPDRLLRRAERERRARKEAERLLEEKSLELYEANQALQRQAAALEEQVQTRTAELHAALERAEEAVRAKSDFLAVMSHEIRTPLNAVIGMSELLSLESLAPEHQEQVSLIHDNGRNLLALINDILDFSKIEAGKLQLEQEVFDPADLLQSTLRSFEAQAAPRGVRLHSQLMPLPQWVVGDRLRLRQVLANLIGNALKFTLRGEVRLEAEANEMPDGWRLQVRVVDSGIGMNAEQQARLFQPFSQADASTSRHFGGTGLGLAICHRLVHEMGGEIACRSAPGEGSVFAFDVQLQRASDVPSARDGADDETLCRCTAPSIRLLIVDDNPVNRLLARRMAERLGHQSEIAASGPEALEMVQQNDYDVILMDFIMPEMDGLETTQRIRALDLPRQPRIVALTANAFPEDRAKALEAGMAGFISKPLRLEQLRLELCSICLAKHAQGSSVVP
ncbi:ATP-binding protein [Thiocapsa marina]|uniref:histidine kinase n=1 Tax=Thiocapsa marina 5811 TaxID=768671 RepID=F9UH76_9GAMM|nr:ATP-binding protein [Thiocapsa marina]EGV16480.1 histidine kinase [Thiocapsa marina 5811]